ncbi:hypothetical protein KFL_008900020 [Klebsormidium nitens]|uniref:Root cap family protein n=1 Tax=Klebsormidium nitens TaxID=105231 RepID=A0A1Y1IM37_KLENI|nr:hypothetical protein KFL_008900020 [Klebsormidium nitens]|eukprot:GAQ91955.1 hypothetical protein KFL_008900020 [Klebsormidium nitens]
MAPSSSAALLVFCLTGVLLQQLVAGGPSSLASGIGGAHTANRFANTEGCDFEETNAITGTPQGNLPTGSYLSYVPCHLFGTPLKDYGFPGYIYAFNTHCLSCPVGQAGCTCDFSCTDAVEFGLSNFFNGGYTYYTHISCQCSSDPTPGACSDPHFVGAYGVNYDFHGVPGRDFTLITDKDLNVNAHFIGQDGTETGFDGTWMSALGVTWTQEDGVMRTLTISLTSEVEDQARTSEAAFVVEVDDVPVEEPTTIQTAGGTSDHLLHNDEGLTITRTFDGRSFTLDIHSQGTLHIMLGHHKHPEGNHLDFSLENLNVTATVHGALGQTFAESHRTAIQEAMSFVGSGERVDQIDIVEGKDADYMTSSLLATDARFNHYQVPNAFLPMTVARKMLTFEDSFGASKKIIVNKITCTGRFSCSAIASAFY